MAAGRAPARPSPPRRRRRWRPARAASGAAAEPVGEARPARWPAPARRSGPGGARRRRPSTPRSGSALPRSSRPACRAARRARRAARRARSTIRSTVHPSTSKVIPAWAKRSRSSTPEHGGRGPVAGGRSVHRGERQRGLTDDRRRRLVPGMALRLDHHVGSLAARRHGLHVDPVGPARRGPRVGARRRVPGRAAPWRRPSVRRTAPGSRPAPAISCWPVASMAAVAGASAGHVRTGQHRRGDGSLPIAEVGPEHRVAGEAQQPGAAVDDRGVEERCREQRRQPRAGAAVTARTQVVPTATGGSVDVEGVWIGRPPIAPAGSSRPSRRRCRRRRRRRSRSSGPWW